MKIQVIIILIVLVILVILVILCGFVIPYYFKKKKKDNYSISKLLSSKYTKEGNIYPIEYNTNKIDVIFINLKQREDRYKIFTNNYYASDMYKNTNLLVLNAFNTINIKKENVKKITTNEAYNKYLFYLKTKTRSSHDSLTKGSIGCYLSHLEIYKYVVDKNKPCLICEDDVEFKKDSYEKILNSIDHAKKINKNEDFMLLFHFICSKDRWKDLKCIKIENNIYKLYQFFSTACYYITPKIARKILEIAFPINIQIDLFLSLCARNNLFNIYGVNIINIFDNSGTDIQDANIIDKKGYEIFLKNIQYEDDIEDDKNIVKNNTIVNSIPNIIWTYWNDLNIPKNIQICIDSWNKYNPEYEIIILNDNTLKYYLKNFDLSYLKQKNYSNARISDFIRLNILSKYGGIWSDASIICNKSYNWIDNLQKEKNSEFIGFYLDGFTLPELKNKSPVIESWFLACVKNSKFVNDWKNEFDNVYNYNENEIENYITELEKNQNVNLQKINGQKNYLAIHCSCQKILQKNENRYNLFLLKAEDTALKYLADTNWDSEKGISNLHMYVKQPILKIRASEREYLDKLDLFNIINKEEDNNDVYQYVDINILPEPQLKSNKNNDIIIVTAFLDINRKDWVTNSREPKIYLESFKKYLKTDYKIILFLDKKYIDYYKPSPNLFIIPIDLDWLKENTYAFKRLDIEKIIMNSDYYKKLVKNRIDDNSAENIYPEYTSINHAKIDLISYCITSKLVSPETFICWSDFGFHNSMENNEVFDVLDINKFDTTKISLSICNKIIDYDLDIYNTLTNPRNVVCGAFFAGKGYLLLTYQKLYHEILDEFEKINIADDDQHIALRCIMKNPKLFLLHDEDKNSYVNCLKYFAKTKNVEIVITN